MFGWTMRIAYKLQWSCVLLIQMFFRFGESYVLQKSILTVVSDHVPPSRPPHSPFTQLQAAAMSPREMEIRRKIAKLKREGRLRKDKATDDFLSELEDDNHEDELARLDDTYARRIQEKLGTKKSRMLGFDTDDDEIEKATEEVIEETASAVPSRRAQIGSMGKPSDDAPSSMTPILDSTTSRSAWIDPILSGNDDEDAVELPEEDLIDMVAIKMQEKRNRERREDEARRKQQARERMQTLEQERQLAKKTQITSGVGGSWSHNTTAATVDLYQPKTGSWGAFPRPRDISRAYGGGRRVGPGYSNEADRARSADETRKRLQQYREKMGIESQLEKDHATEIDEAISIATVAMQRGVYATAVSALEKVTKYCSSNSKVGGKVFLELAMAYEAMGRAEEAIQVYKALSKCRIEEIKMNAKRLLYGIEAMEFMKKEMSNDQFSRKRARNTFIDTTGMSNFATHFDDVYNTAYIDLDSGFYKQLTKSVVRSPREARQILLQAVSAGEVSRLRIVQALRSLSRHFDDALQAEMERNVVQEPVAVLDGQPILQRRQTDDSVVNVGGMETFLLSEAEQMMDNLNGEWRLQLLADKKGDGVKYFNTTTAWQQVDTNERSFVALTPSSFVTVQQNGGIEFNAKRRILRRSNVELSGGGILGNLLSSTTTGAMGAVRAPQQVVMVDSILLVTRGVPNKRLRNKDDEKDYFAVWRRVEPGTYSQSISSR